MEVQNKQGNQLVHLAAFQTVLASYYPSESSIATFRSIPLVILVGPTASGRNTLIGILVATARYKMIVSDTTRQPRINNGIPEQNGREYWFKTEEAVLRSAEAGEYIEAAVIHSQQVSGAHINEFERIKNSGLIALKEIEPHGAELYHRLHPELLAIFLLPPNFPVWMERLKGRGDMSDEELVRRMQSALEEIDTALTTDFYQFVINNEIHEAAHAVDELASGREPNADKQARGREHAETLKIHITEYLNGA